MKTISLPTVQFTAFGTPSELNYKTLLQTIIEAPEDPAKGASIEEIRRAVRVLDALENCWDTVTLEDADYDYMLRRVRAARFTSSNQAFIDFVSHFEA